MSGLQRSASPASARALRFGVLVVVYVLAARASLALDAVSGFASLVWPATGIALVALLYDRRLWPAVWIGAFVANSSVGASIPTAFGIAVGNTLEAVLGAFMLNSIPGFRPSLDRLVDALGLCVLAAFVSTAVSATCGTLSLWLGGYVPDHVVFATWRAWWFGDMIGDLVFAPPLLVWFAPADEASTPPRFEVALFALAALLFNALILGTGTAHQDTADLYFPLLIWAAVRYGVRGTVSTLLGVMALAVTATALGVGPFVRTTLHESLLVLQRFMGVASATFVVLGAAISERTRSVMALHSARGDLELRVTERTADLQRANDALLRQGETLKDAQAELERRVEARTVELTKLDKAFRAVVGACPLAILAVDRETRFTVWNHEAERLFGLSESAVMGQPIHTLRPQATWPEELSRALGGEALRSLEIHWSASPRGALDLLLSTASLFDTSGQLDGVMAVVADVTEQNRIVDERLKLAAIVESSSEAIIAWDVEGNITSWNEGAVRLFQYEPDEVIGGPMALLIPEHRLVEALEVRMRVVQGIPMGAYETERRRRDGSTIDVSISASPVRSSRGVIVGGSTIARDVTERKRAEAERARLLEELSEAVNSRDALISIASHELRTPLTALQLQLQLLAKQDRDSRVLPAVVGQAARLARLINNLLEVSRITAGTLQLEPAEVDLTRMAQDVVAHYRAEIRGGTEIDVVADGAVVGLWDPVRLEQIVNNLVSNAIKYGAGKPIEVRIERTDTIARLVVSDHGIGIAHDDQARIFERFERLVSERSVSGFGLGLWIVRQIVDAMQGRISVTSILGEGSRFTVELPLQASAPVATAHIGGR
jgi:PAS domain S-box-containing protein